jgi:hypothetical protein
VTLRNSVRREIEGDTKFSKMGRSLDNVLVSCVSKPNFLTCSRTSFVINLRDKDKDNNNNNNNKDILRRVFNPFQKKV